MATVPASLNCLNRLPLSNLSYHSPNCPDTPKKKSVPFSITQFLLIQVLQENIIEQISFAEYPICLESSTSYRRINTRQRQKEKPSITLSLLCHNKMGKKKNMMFITNNQSWIRVHFLNHSAHCIKQPQSLLGERSHKRTPAKPARLAQTMNSTV